VSGADAVAARVVAKAHPDAGTVRIGVMPGMLPADVVEQFNHETGLHVEIIDCTDFSQARNALENQPAWDALIAPDELVSRLHDENVLAKLPIDELSNLRHVVDVHLRPPHDPRVRDAVPLLFVTVGFAYDRKILPRVPTRWTDFFDTQDQALQARLYLDHDPRIAVGTALVHLGKSPNTTSSVEIDEAEGLLQRIRPMLGTFLPANIVDEIAHERCVFAVVTSDIGIAAEVSNRDIIFIEPNDRSVVRVISAAIGKRSHNAAGAVKLINFLLRPEIGARLSDETYYYTTLEKTSAFSKDRNDMLSTEFVPEADLMSRVIDDVGPARVLYENAWLSVWQQPAHSR
jgi:spermidine/putrescine transport system substrate-binding protein